MIRYGVDQPRARSRRPPGFSAYLCGNIIAFAGLVPLSAEEVETRPRPRARPGRGRLHVPGPRRRRDRRSSGTRGRADDAEPGSGTRSADPPDRAAFTLVAVGVVGLGEPVPCRPPATRNAGSSGSGACPHSRHRGHPTASISSGRLDVARQLGESAHRQTCRRPHPSYSASTKMNSSIPSSGSGACASRTVSR